MTVFEATVVPFPDDSPEAWETCILGQHSLKVARDGVHVSRGKKQDKKAAPGKHGTTTTGQGFEAAKIDITWIIYPEEGEIPYALWEDSQRILADLEDPSKKEPALSVIHPATAARRVSAVTIDSIDGPTWGDVVTYHLKCTEHLAEPEKKKGAGGKTGGGGTKPGVPFLATFQLAGTDETGQNVITRILVVEGPKGTFRTADGGLLVTGVFLGTDDPKFPPGSLTPLEQEEADAAAKNGGVPPGDASVTNTPTGAEGSDSNQYAGGGAHPGAQYEGADIPSEDEGDADP